MLMVITGPPCSGKSTYVAEHRARADVVLDLDEIARALGYPADHVEWNDPHAAVAAARAARKTVLDLITTGRARCDAWLIDTKPHPTSLHIYRRHGARIINLDPGRETCHDRAAHGGRTASTHQQIDAWYGPTKSSPAALDIFG